MHTWTKKILRSLVMAAVLTALPQSVYFASAPAQFAMHHVRHVALNTPLFGADAPGVVR